jgi:phosphate:Na+ symporter
MIIMTEGLRALPGDTLRHALMRFTHTPLSGAMTGAATTAILQSSSATTVAAVSFVGAGLMSFPAALGIIFGANIGTTITGWLVALIGFKLKIGMLALPFVFIGVLLRLFVPGRLSYSGYALAGFGLIFVGISTLQESMVGLQELISFDELPAESIPGRIKLIGIGVIFTVITQSSSAGVATALTALYAGMINFEQAAALVIGMDVGTTVKAGLATIGGNLGARRTGLSHIIYNICTGVAALFYITPFMIIMEKLLPGQLVGNAEIALVAFHSSFNLLGVIIVLPFTRPFARFIEFVVRGKQPMYTRDLDKRLLKEPELALTAIQHSTRLELQTLLRHLLSILGDKEEGRLTNLADLHQALDETHAYLDQIHLSTDANGNMQRLIQFIHTLDHLQRLHERCEEEEDRAITVRGKAQLLVERDLLIASIRDTLSDMELNAWTEMADRSQQVTDKIHEKVRPYRAQIMHRIGTGELSIEDGTDCLEAIRWLRRVSKHVARISQHYRDAMEAVGG